MKTIPEIHSITEAFSMQPNVFHVGGYVDSKTRIAKIVQEDILITGDPYPYYVGYDESGNRLFEYKKGTVNVHFKPVAA